MNQPPLQAPLIRPLQPPGPATAPRSPVVAGIALPPALMAFRWSHLPTLR